MTEDLQRLHAALTEMRDRLEAGDERMQRMRRVWVSTHRSGVPMRVEDPAAIDKIVTLIRAGH